MPRKPARESFEEKIRKDSQLIQLARTFPRCTARPIPAHASDTMKITEDLREYAAGEAITKVEALKRSMEEKSKKFVKRVLRGLRQGENLLYGKK